MGSSELIAACSAGREVENGVKALRIQGGPRSSIGINETLRFHACMAFIIPDMNMDDGRPRLHAGHSVPCNLLRGIGNRGIHLLSSTVSKQCSSYDQLVVHEMHPFFL